MGSGFDGAKNRGLGVPGEPNREAGRAARGRQAAPQRAPGWGCRCPHGTQLARVGEGPILGGWRGAAPSLADFWAPSPAACPLSKQKAPGGSPLPRAVQQC